MGTRPASCPKAPSLLTSWDKAVPSSPWVEAWLSRGTGTEDVFLEKCPQPRHVVGPVAEPALGLTAAGLSVDTGCLGTLLVSLPPVTGFNWLRDQV